MKKAKIAGSADHHGDAARSVSDIVDLVKEEKNPPVEKMGGGGGEQVGQKRKEPPARDDELSMEEEDLFGFDFMLFCAETDTRWSVLDDVSWGHLVRGLAGGATAMAQWRFEERTVPLMKAAFDQYLKEIFGEKVIATNKLADGFFRAPDGSRFTAMLLTGVERNGRDYSALGRLIRGAPGPTEARSVVAEARAIRTACSDLRRGSMSFHNDVVNSPVGVLLSNCDKKLADPGVSDAKILRKVSFVEGKPLPTDEHHVTDPCSALNAAILSVLDGVTSPSAVAAPNMAPARSSKKKKEARAQERAEWQLVWLTAQRTVRQMAHFRSDARARASLYQVQHEVGRGGFGQLPVLPAIAVPADDESPEASRLRWLDLFACLRRALDLLPFMTLAAAKGCGGRAGRDDAVTLTLADDTRLRQLVSALAPCADAHEAWSRSMAPMKLAILDRLVSQLDELKGVGNLVAKYVRVRLGRQPAFGFLNNVKAELGGDQWWSAILHPSHCNLAFAAVLAGRQNDHGQAWAAFLKAVKGLFSAPAPDAAPVPEPEEIGGDSLAAIVRAGKAAVQRAKAHGKRAQAAQAVLLAKALINAPAAVRDGRWQLEPLQFWPAMFNAAGGALKIIEPHIMREVVVPCESLLMNDAVLRPIRQLIGRGDLTDEQLELVAGLRFMMHESPSSFDRDRLKQIYIEKIKQHG